MDYFPLDVHRLNHKYVRQRGHRMPLIMIKTIMFQLARALVFLHARSICHRDAKPGNLLVDSETGVVKLCDFGCAKKMQPLGDHEPPEKNVSYICSRPYRAPELLLGSLYYRFHVDMWAFGCVLAELLCGKVLFMGSSTVDQMIEIFKVLGVPSTQELAALNPHFTSMPGMTASPWSAVHGFQFETATPSSPTSSNPHGSDYFQRYQALHVKSLQWDSVLPPNTPESAISLIGGLLRYTPGDRLTAAEVLEHAFFDDLFAADARLPNGNPLPVSMFQVTKEELEVLPPWLLERMAVSERVAKENQASTQPEA
uniref:Uncharacterized protein TCIL3000_7_1730 n=1 Tax=Trypanosoma congolense (strain IL3000) TaxID=1068625 RepID=G0UPQ4_TRYCI|nr:unnamed protein product [Trypanosoma congolense IL3000]